jgi:hypothetical protein
MALVAIALSATALVATPPPPAAAQSLCLADYTYHMVYIEKYAWDVPGGTFFNGARGDATVQVLNPCTYFAGLTGISSILAANLQGAHHAYQIAWSYKSQDPYHVAHFTYTQAGDASGTEINWPGTLTPVVGTRYRFGISRQWMSADGGYWAAKYTITRLSDGFVETKYGDWTDTDRPYYSWWGAEGANGASDCGSVYPANTNMAFMGYQINGEAWAGRYRTSLTNNDIHDNCDHGQGYIGTWYYQGDMLNVFAAN